MISRFTNIKNIGRFSDCQIGGRNFEKNTIIFGQNAGGKSTLTDIFWSFKTGDKSFIEGRKTFGSTGEQRVEFFDENNKPFRYPSAEWNLGYNNIEIFDTQFINENIFEGNEITYGHQKKLNSVIIGPEGKKLTNEINLLQNEISELTSKKSSRTIEFNRVFKKGITAKEFAVLPKVEDVDEKVKKIQASIEILNNKSKIKAVIESLESLLVNIINQKTKRVLSKLIQIKADLVIEHILKTWKNPSRSKDFLQTGLDLTKTEYSNCVFCGQELNESAKQLLYAYSQLFSVEYTSLQSEILGSFSKFEKWNPLTFIESIQDKLASVKLSLDLSEINLEVLKELKEEINKEFSLKSRDLSYNVNFDKYDSLIQIFIEIKLLLDELKSKNIFSPEISIDSLRTEIKELELSKIRHTEEWINFLKEYEKIDHVQEIKKHKRELLREELDGYSQNIFDTHLDTINKVLQELGADFIICDFNPIRKIVGRSERIFALKFFSNYKVSIDETASNMPNFKNTLSESDKRVLAFSFFYSLMVHDDGLNDKIVVFDDPFSSFDSDRRLRTVQLLSNPYLITPDGEIVEKIVNQLIILTHESEFFKWIYQKLDDPKPLKIIPDGIKNGVKKSTIVDCNVEKEFLEDKTKKDLKLIQIVYSSNKPISNYEELCVKCRIILESVFTRKYLFDLDEEINSRKSIRSFVSKLEYLKINDFEKTPKKKDFIFLCDNLNIELHDNELKNEGENGKDVLGDFLRLLKQI